MKKQLLLFVLAVILYFFGLYTLIRNIEPFYYYFYITSWWSYIIFLDDLLSLKYKRFSFSIDTCRFSSLFLADTGVFLNC